MSFYKYQGIQFDELFDTSSDSGNTSNNFSNLPNFQTTTDETSIYKSNESTDIKYFNNGVSIINTLKPTVNNVKTTSQQVLDGSAHWNPADASGLCYIKTNLGSYFPYGNGIIGVKTHGNGTSAGGTTIFEKSWAGFFNQNSNKRWSDIIAENRFNDTVFNSTFKLLHFEYIGADLLQIKIRALANGYAAYAALTTAEQAQADALDLNIYEFFYKAGSGSNAIYNYSTSGTPTE